MIILRRCLLSLTLLTASACTTPSEPQPLRPTPSPNAEQTIPTDPLSSVDQPGRLPQTGEPLPPARPANQKQQPKTSLGLQGPSETVNQNVKLPWLPENPTAPSTAASTRPTIGVPLGQFTILGGVVAEVNGAPIYADKVLSTLEPLLAARARETDARQFRQVAERAIKSQRDDMISAELEYAAAVRNLEPRYKELANNLTMDWRKQQIAAGEGSLELARRRAVERGQTFEDMVADKYREFMSRLYYETKLMPRIEVTARDMRDYYNKHLTTEFTQPAKARFRLIKISVKQVGTHDAALNKITELRDRITKGEDVAAIAGTVNHDPALLKSAGEFEAQRGAFAVAKVEDAIWNTPTDQLTPIIDAGDALYLAKVEEKKNGRVIPFDEEGVQARIQATMRSEQFRKLRDQVRQALEKDAIVRTDDQMLATAIDMAMQNYPRWSAASAVPK